MKLIEGGIYMTRIGEVIGPLTHREDGQYPWGAQRSGREITFSSAGWYFAWKPSEFDIVKIVTEEPGWLPWKGGDCPVDSATKVRVILRAGDRDELGMRAGLLRWNSKGSPSSGDIVAYKVVEETKTSDCIAPELGGIYLDRNGDPHAIVGFDTTGEGGSYPFSDSEGASYGITGAYYNDEESEFDLVKHVVTGDGWRAWTGACEGPAPQTHVEYILRNGRRFNVLAHFLDWNISKGDYDVVAYRVVKETTSALSVETKTLTLEGEDDANPKMKFGASKPSLEFVPPVALIEESVVMRLGAQKYGPFNWQDKAVRFTTYYSAAMRHLMAMYAGEDTDPESQALHAAHVRACMGIIIDARATGMLIDDRPAKCGNVSDAIVKHTVKAA